MTAPFFYSKEYDAGSSLLTLDEATSRHIVQVLRMKKGDMLRLTDGRGSAFTAVIVEEHKKRSVVSVKEKVYKEAPQRKTCIAISLLKNVSRFEWFLEKATELGTTEIVPLLCKRTEKEQFRMDRMQGICVSAMLQSQQYWLPVLHEPIPFDKWVSKAGEYEQKFMAHCEEQARKQPLRNVINYSSSSVVAIGPEGDFDVKEIELALQHNFVPVSLGETRLRTETAGIVAATWISRKD